MTPRPSPAVQELLDGTANLCKKCDNSLNGQVSAESLRHSKMDLNWRMRNAEAEIESALRRAKSQSEWEIEQHKQVSEAEVAAYVLPKEHRQLVRDGERAYRAAAVVRDKIVYQRSLELQAEEEAWAKKSFPISNILSGYCVYIRLV